MALAGFPLRRLPRLTLLGRSLLLLSLEILANVLCWIGAGILFGRHKETHSIISLALLAWVRTSIFDSRINLSLNFQRRLDCDTVIGFLLSLSLSSCTLLPSSRRRSYKCNRQCDSRPDSTRSIAGHLWTLFLAGAQYNRYHRGKSLL